MKIRNIYTREVGEIVATHKENNKIIYTVQLDSGACKVWYKEQVEEVMV